MNDKDEYIKAITDKTDSIVIKKGAKGDITWEVKIYFNSSKENEIEESKGRIDDLIIKINKSIEDGEYT